MEAFTSFDVLIPKGKYMANWPVIACDQFTSQPEYWEKVRTQAEGVPSAFHCILPESGLTAATEETYAGIRRSMEAFLRAGVFKEYRDSFVYVERTLQDGSIRAGVVGVLDLEQYDYHSDARAAVRATERTVEERIPPRMKIRRGAQLELSHVLLLCDDGEMRLIEPLAEEKARLKMAYDLDLMLGGGHISGWLLQGAPAAAFRQRLQEYADRCAAKYGGEGVAPVLYAVGDGNHSLATAKECYEEMKANSVSAESLRLARYAMVELGNIHAPSLKFEPIHRIVTDADVDALLEYAKGYCAPDGYPIGWVADERRGTIYLDRSRGEMEVGILQKMLDEYLRDNAGSIDYIHGEDALRQLSARKNAVGFLLPAISKESLFRGIARDGVLPRKTFSMGESVEKRYYLEARKIR